MLKLFKNGEQKPSLVWKYQIKSLRLQSKIRRSKSYRIQNSFLNRTYEKGAFNYYVDRILPFFDPPPPAWTVFMPWAWTKTDIFWPPHLVHVVIEWPPNITLIRFAKFLAKIVLMTKLLQNYSNLNDLEYSRHLKARKLKKRPKYFLKANHRPEVEKLKFSYSFGLLKINWK